MAKSLLLQDDSGVDSGGTDPRNLGDPNPTTSKAKRKTKRRVLKPFQMAPKYSIHNRDNPEDSYLSVSLPIYPEKGKDGWRVVNRSFEAKYGLVLFSRTSPVTVKFRMTGGPYSYRLLLYTDSRRTKKIFASKRRIPCSPDHIISVPKENLSHKLYLKLRLYKGVCQDTSGDIENVWSNIN